MQLTVAKRASAPISSAAFIFATVIITRINWVANALSVLYIISQTPCKERKRVTTNKRSKRLRKRASTKKVINAVRKNLRRDK